MGISWTDEQKSVINSRHGNLLVSAAAGSGKTAVLVERILEMVMGVDADGNKAEEKIDIDEVLVVTFTRAAAAQMKEKIADKLEQAAEEHPEDEHIVKQLSLLPRADIMTIDSFCLGIVKDYFQMLGIDSSFDIADNAEMDLIKNDILDEVLEQKYQEASDEFIGLVDSFARKESDEKIRELVYQIYRVASGYPKPERWINEAETALEVSTKEELYTLKWYRDYMQIVADTLDSAIGQAEQCLEIAGEADGPAGYDPIIRLDLELLRNLRQAEDMDEAYKRVSKFSNLKRIAACDPEKQQYVKTTMQTYRGSVKDMMALFRPTGVILAECAMMKGPLSALLSLTRSYMERLKEEKLDRNLYEFRDISEFAYDILCAGTDENGCVIPSEAGKTVAGRYREILIDEYQDSNFLQEDILNCVTGHGEDRKNMFMVGDIKQSIYGFRLARPELFLEKYHTYAKDGESQQRIDLDKNFRSRPEVLAGANYVFRKLMSPELGGIAYDEAASLHAGAAFPKKEEGNTDLWQTAYETELLLLDDQAPELEDDKSRETKMETEAAAVAARIREMVGKEEVVDKETGEYRKIQYRDIVILLRAVSGWSETFSRVLQAAGIPAYSTSKTGYFSTQEIVTVLNYLHLCDNPCQEIPFTAILRSPICGCTDAELAAVRCVDKDVKIYEACGKYAAEGEDEALRKKLGSFLEQLEMLRSRVPYTPIHELITQILDETGYGGYASAMPGGVQRRANLEMLVEKAVEFEATSYRGLFNFIRYIEQLQKYEVDFGEVNIYGESADTVRIMSIHKSKGLEFPVVFLSGMGKSFNQMDSRAALVLHSRMGIGADAIDPEHRVRQATLPRQIIRQSMKLENLAEELRVLYVAMTRPKEKLIMTGMASKLESRVKQCAAHAGRQEELLSYQTLSSASGYLDWILPAFSRNRCFDGLYEQFGLAGNADNPLYAEKIPVTIRFVSPVGLVEGEVLHQMERAVNEQKIMEIPKQPPREAALKELVEERFAYQYPYEKEKQIPVKVTVSQLKKAGMEESEIGKELFAQEELVPIVPGFLKKDHVAALTGSDRGTAYHRLLECLDYRRAYSITELMAQTEELIAEGKMTKEAAECIYFKSILAFAKSPVGMRLRNAFLNETLKREQPFVMSVPASEADPSYPEDETILVQGIIDAWFPEGDEIVLVDYKTDRVKEAGELKKRYEKQLAYYQQALERTTGKKVKEKIIYSLALDEELVL